MQRRPRRPAGQDPGLFDAPPTPREGEPQPSGDPSPPWTVSSLTQEIADRVGAMGRLRVEGEVSEPKETGRGHLFFTLKDDSARLTCAVWASQLRRLRERPEEGAQIVAHGRLDVYAPSGSYKLIVERVEPLGIGALLARLEALKKELAALGWFERRRSLPAQPRMIGVVTSRDGAALRDFLRTRSLRWPGYPVRLAHTVVQGPGASKQIAEAIDRLSTSSEVDLIVVCRGGGSLEDLWAFNERPVAEAIWRSPVPVVSGVGHETDTTLADLVADARAHTPTDAAQMVIPDRAALAARLWAAAERLEGLMSAQVVERARGLERLFARARQAVDARGRDAAARLSAAHARLERRSPRAELERSDRRLRSSGSELERGMERRMERAAGKIAELARGLEATSPLAVLGRGYSVTRVEGVEAAVIDAGAVTVGDLLATRLSRGSLRSRVEQIELGEDER